MGVPGNGRHWVTSFGSANGICIDGIDYQTFKSLNLCLYKGLSIWLTESPVAVCYGLIDD